MMERSGRNMFAGRKISFALGRSRVLPVNIKGISQTSVPESSPGPGSYRLRGSFGQGNKRSIGLPISQLTQSVQPGPGSYNLPGRGIIDQHSER